MTKTATAKTGEQFASMFVTPLRAYGALNLETAEKLVAAQFGVAESLSEATLAQARSWLSVKGVEDFQKALDGQQQTMKSLGERMKSDAETLMSLGQDYVQKSQKLVEGQMKAAGTS
ncbi:phasin family protein [Halomonas organivorans]|uniref:Phosphopantetheinyl transferase (Holo-ACP synthase) n=1 Tax=Halomonas organivorans TaxID=257772 RepID=A0A7W5G3D8_9GAMM|nr:phasin family protein [Halomonas organivorans]MBB3139188.1 phosphopantetheinyl transferase (holo-ACP synthase) [Halomonas organivorans]